MNLPFVVGNRDQERRGLTELLTPGNVLANF